MIRRLRNSKFVKDTVTFQVASLVSSVGNFLGTVALAFVLGAREQGDYFVAISLYSLFFLLLSTGANQAAVSQVAAAGARGNREKEAIWLAFLLKAYVAIGVLLVGVGAVLLPRVAGSDLLGGDRHIGVLAWWLCVTPLLEMPRAVCTVAFQATRRMRPLAQTENVHELVRVFLVTAGALVTGGADGAILGTLCASLVGSITAMELYRRARVETPATAEGDAQPSAEVGPLPGALEILSHFRDVPLGRGMPLGMRIGLLRSIDALGLQVLPMLIIKALVGSEVVAYTRIAQRIMNVPMMLMGGISRAVFPVLSRLAGLKDMVAFRRTFLRTTFVGGAFVSAGILVALPFVHFVVAAFLPPEYVEPVTHLCLILALGCIALSFAIGLDSFYIVTNSMNGAIWLNSIGLVVTAGATAYFCLRFPETGGAWGIAFAMSWGIFHYFYVAWVLAVRRAESTARAEGA